RVQQFYFKSPDKIGDPYSFDLQVVAADDARPIDWSVVQSNISSTVTGLANFPAIFAALQQRIGTTWGDYVKMLARNATLLPSTAIFGSNTSEFALLNLEVHKVIATLGTSISGTLSAPDPRVAIAGRTIYATDASTFDFTTF